MGKLQGDLAARPEIVTTEEIGLTTQFRLVTKMIHCMIKDMARNKVVAKVRAKAKAKAKVREVDKAKEVDKVKARVGFWTELAE